MTRNQICASCPSSGSFLYSVNHMAIKHANPPKTLEIGSARNTPSTPNPSPGNKSVSGTTMITFLNSEKKMARFQQRIAVNAVCPPIWNAINTKPKKYRNNECVPLLIISASFVKTDISALGNISTSIQATSV